MKDSTDELAEQSSSKQSTSWLGKITHSLIGPKNLNDLMEIITIAAKNEAIDSQTKAMIQGVINVSNQKVRDIMVPRAQMVTVSNSMPLESIIKEVSSSTHTRIPVFDEQREDICGILHTKDLLQHFIDNKSTDNFNIESVLRPVIFIPESKKLDSLLKDFKNAHIHLAIIVDEYGTISGLVTIEDILEEIVGEIEDEFDQEEEHILKLSDNEYIIDAITEIDEFNEVFGSNYSDINIDTIGGLIIQSIERLPQEGEVITLDKFIFTVLNADTRRINKLNLKLNDK
ncbi:MAG: magnesium and cobalt transporter [Francisellaceae bacterium]|jgi:magnesium and cobalt transporter